MLRNPCWSGTNCWFSIAAASVRLTCVPPIGSSHADNAITTELAAQLIEILETIAARSSVRVAVITGAGDRAFSIGGDLRQRKAMTKEQWLRQRQVFDRVLYTLRQLSRPIIAAIRGMAYGGGCEIAISTDFIIASDDAVFGQPEAMVGLSAGGGGPVFLPRVLPPGKALQMLMTGEPITAQEAHRLGMVNELHPKAELMDRFVYPIHAPGTRSPLRHRSEAFHSAASPRCAEETKVPDVVFVRARASTWPEGPKKDLIDAVVAMKHRNPSWGCPRIAQQIALAFGVAIGKDVVRRILSLHYRPESDSGGPSWLIFLGHTKDSLWSCDLFRCESATLRTHWVLLVMDQFTRRIIGFGVHSGTVDGVALCRMFHRAIRGHSLPKYLRSDHDPLYRFHQFRGRLPRDVRTRQSPGAHRCGISCIDRTRKTAKSKNKRPPVDISFSLLSRKSLHSLRQPQVSKFLEGLIPSRQVSRQVSDRCRSRLDPAELYLGHLARHAAIVEAATTLTHRHCSHPLRRVCGRRSG